jgi:beta-mannosidase
MRWKTWAGIIAAIYCLNSPVAAAQDVLLHSGWQFRRADTGKWYPATVPGTIHTDLMAAGLINDPYYGDNEHRVQWVEEAEWEYRCSFNLPGAMQSARQLFLQFDGLDTRANVYLNGVLILQADNMFRQWTVPVKSGVSHTRNILLVRFLSASHIARIRKAKEPVPYPENERIYIRKAQYQFGWDWGPRLVTAGIWRIVRLTASPAKTEPSPRNIAVQLIRTNDEAGQSFYFTRNGKPVYIKGANWIPLDNFIPRAVKLLRYEQVIRQAKEAGINMLRVWGGGIYEEDIFYDLCDRYGIMVWQDFMFAGAMYPGDTDFIRNVEAEVHYQVGRLRHHRCIALWCGNNEIDEAWHNWGWQHSLHYSPADSAKIWTDYKKLFQQLIPGILKELDPGRPYWPSSPATGWGRKEAYTQGDVHYWGVWWGREPVSMYKQMVGRFNSEYGMQAFPAMATIKAFSTPADWDTAGVVMKAHQKHPFGYENIGMYIGQRFPAPKSFEDLVYMSGMMQADAIGTAISAHRAAKPYNMGTMFWQLNDCWPGITWSSIDYYARKKPLHYRLHELYTPVLIVVDSDTKGIKITVSSETDLYRPLQLRVSAHYLNGRKEALQDTSFTVRVLSDSARHYSCHIPDSISRQAKDVYYLVQLVQGKTTIASSTYFLVAPKELHLSKPALNWSTSGDLLHLQSDAFVYGLEIQTPDSITPGDNYFHLLPGVEKTIQIKHKPGQSIQRQDIRFRSLRDTQMD